jgi:hypothetical protein
MIILIAVTTKRVFYFASYALSVFISDNYNLYLDGSTNSQITMFLENNNAILIFVFIINFRIVTNDRFLLC